MKTKAETGSKPVQGKTFSLFGNDECTEAYYHAVHELADLCLEHQPDIMALVTEVRRLGKRPRLARKFSSPGGTSLQHIIVQTADRALSPYTTAVEGHLRELSLIKRFDGVLAFTREQYHLAMLEIELMNRAFGEQFRKQRRKLAFLPHCLRDLTADCKAAPRDIDYACRGCSALCSVNEVSALLRQRHIEPYLWMQAGLASLFRKLRAEEGGLGVLGIACVPELVRGMRMCHKLDVPVVGIPLNANRCARWMGTFHATSVELDRVDSLVSADLGKD